LTVTIVGDGVSTSVVVNLGFTPTAASATAAYDATFNSVLANISSVVPGSSSVTINFVAAFSGSILVLLALSSATCASAQLQPVTGTFWQATQPVSGTLSVNALPAGANTIGKVDILGNAGAILDGATGAAVPANGIYNGVRAATANPANATGGNLVGIMADKAGRLVVTHSHVRDLQGSQTTTIAASGTETTIVAAGAAGVFNDLCMLVISGQSTAATVWTLRSATAGTPIASFNAPIGNPVIVKFDPPLAQATAANNWTIQAGTGTSTGAQIFAQFIKNT
jgi:hypothetical protein